MFLRLLLKRPSGLWGRLISWKTRGQYSHTELWFDGEPEAAQCFSAREGQKSGFKTIDLTAHNWDVIEITFDPVAATEAYDAAVKLSGQRYDWLGVSAFEFHWLHEDAEDLFCSEACSLVLESAGLLKLDEAAAKISPVELSILASATYGPPQVLTFNRHFTILARASS